MTPGERLSRQLDLGGLIELKIFSYSNHAGSVEFSRMTIDGLAPIFSIKRDQEPYPYKLTLMLRLSSNFPYLDQSKPVHLFISSISTDETMDIGALYGLINHIRFEFELHVDEVYLRTMRIFL